MSTDAHEQHLLESRFEALKKAFDNAEGIYVEQAFHHVKISGVRFERQTNMLFARVTPLKTPGIYDETALRAELREGWRIGSGIHTEYSSNRWAMGYGGWQLYIDPQITARVLGLAAEWDESVHYYARYKDVLELLQGTTHSPAMEPFF